MNSGSWWWTGRPGVLWFMGSQRVGHDRATELNWTDSVKVLCERKFRPGKHQHLSSGAMEAGFGLWMRFPGSLLICPLAWHVCELMYTCLIVVPHMQCFYLLSWNRVDLQCCVHVCCTAKWVGYTYINLCVFTFFSIMLYDQILNIVSRLCRRTLLFLPILCMIVLSGNSKFPLHPSSAPPLWQPQVCSPCLYACFCLLDKFTWLLNALGGRSETLAHWQQHKWKIMIGEEGVIYPTLVFSLFDWMTCHFTQEISLF